MQGTEYYAMLLLTCLAFPYNAADITCHSYKYKYLKMMDVLTDCVSMQAIQKAMQKNGLKVNVEAVNYDGEYHSIIIRS